MELKTKDSKIFGQTVCFPDLGDVKISDDGKIDVPENILQNVDFASLGFYTESQLLELSKEKESTPLSEQPLDTTKTKSEIIKELQIEIETLKSQKQESSDEEILSAISTLNEENEKLSSDNKRLVEENSKLKEQLEALTKTQSSDKKDKKQ